MVYSENGGCHTKQVQAEWGRSIDLSANFSVDTCQLERAEPPGLWSCRGVDSHLVAQVKAMLENPGQLEQELKVVREVAGLVELALQQARGVAGGMGCSPAIHSVRFRVAGSWTFWSWPRSWMMASVEQRGFSMLFSGRTGLQTGS